MHSFRTLILFSFFAILGISANQISAQTIDDVDIMPGYFNFKFGTPKSELLKYMKPFTDTLDANGNPKKKSYMIDMSLDNRYGKAFGNDISSIQLNFDSEDKLNKISMSFYVPMDDESQFNTKLKSTFNFIKKLFGKHTNKLQSTEGLIYYWTGNKNEVAFTTIPLNFSKRYLFAVDVLRR